MTYSCSKMFGLIAKLPSIYHVSVWTLAKMTQLLLGKIYENTLSCVWPSDPVLLVPFLYVAVHAYLVSTSV